MYLVKTLSRDKGSGRYTMYLPLFALQIPWGEKGRCNVYLPDPLSREGLYQIHGQSLSTHRGKHRSGGAQEFIVVIARSQSAGHDSRDIFPVGNACGDHGN